MKGGKKRNKKEKLSASVSKENSRKKEEHSASVSKENSRKKEEQIKMPFWNRKQKQKFALICILVIFSILASLYFDSSLIRYVSLIRNSVLDTFFLWVNFATSEIIIFLVLTSFFVLREKRRWILPLWITVGISAIVSFILKVTIQRPRPFQLGIISLFPQLQEASHLIWNFSFPSSHAMLAFCAVPILSEQYPKLKKVWIAIAVIIALSRVYLGMHFVSDVIGGAFMGYLIGFMMARAEREHKFGRNVYNKIFGK